MALTVNTIVVGGGGGGGGASPAGAGGGGGQFQSNASFPVTAQAYSITVGAGGTVGNNADGSTGGSSVFDSITSVGGAGGKSNTNGGAGGASGGSTGAGGARAGNGVAGGVGASSSISGASVTYGGGGGGGSSVAGSGGAGGSGGGGTGGSQTTNDQGTAGTANTGGGGGGGGNTSPYPGNTGGSGVVIIAYPTGTLSATGGTITTSDGNTIHTFTSNGTWTLSTVAHTFSPTTRSYALTAISVNLVRSVRFLATVTAFTLTMGVAIITKKIPWTNKDKSANSIITNRDKN